jgi:hypothetical protein
MAQRTELGTTLLIELDGITAQTVYFRCLLLALPASLGGLSAVKFLIRSAPSPGSTTPKELNFPYSRIGFSARGWNPKARACALSRFGCVSCTAVRLWRTHFHRMPVPLSAGDK